MTNRPELRRAAEETRRLYDKLDPIARTQATKHNVPCKAGCIGCCYQMTTITLPEGLVIADTLMKREDWKTWARKLGDEAAKPYPMNRDEYMQMAILCLFIDDDKKCMIYDDRPSPCRYPYVVVNPEACFPAETSQRTLNLNLTILEAHVWRLAKDMFGEFGQFNVAPIPLMTLYCMGLLVSKRQRKFVEIIAAGLSNPGQWSARQVAEALISGEDMEIDEHKRAIIESSKALGVFE